MHYPILGYSNLISLQINSFSANIFRITDFRRFGRPQLGNNIIIRDSTSGPTLFGISLMNRRPCFSFEIKNRMAYRPCVVWNVCGPLIWLHSRCIRFHHMCQIFTRAITVITTRETKLSVGFDRMHGFCSIRSQWIFHNLPVPRSSDNGECRLPDNWIRFWIGAFHFRSNAMLFVAAPSNWRGKCSPPEWCVCVYARWFDWFLWWTVTHVPQPHDRHCMKSASDSIYHSFCKPNALLSAIVCRPSNRIGTWEFRHTQFDLCVMPNVHSLRPMPNCKQSDPDDGGGGSVGLSRRI